MDEAPAAAPPASAPIITADAIIATMEENKKRRLMEGYEESPVHLFASKVCDLVREARALSLGMCWEDNQVALRAIWANLREHGDVVGASNPVVQPWATSELTNHVLTLYLHVVDTSHALRKIAVVPATPTVPKATTTTTTNLRESTMEAPTQS